MYNQEIRRKAKEKGVYLWQIAEKLGVCDMTLTRKLRHELPENEKTEILDIIDSISASRKAG